MSLSTTWKVILTVCHVFTVSTTAFRFYSRVQRKLFWWDDAIVIPVFLTELVSIPVFWMRLAILDGSHRKFPIIIPWLSSFTISTVLWVSRISLCLSIYHIFPRNSRQRRAAFLLACFFGSIYVTLISLKLPCITDPSWQFKIFSIYGCKSSLPITIFGIGADVLSDFLLVAFPLSQIWDTTELPKREYRAVMTAFSASFLTLVIAVCFCILMFVPMTNLRRRPILFTGLAHFEASMALVASNLITIIAYMYRLIWRKRDIDDEIAQGRPRIYISRSSFVADPVGQRTIDLVNTHSQQEAVDVNQDHDEDSGQNHARQDSDKSFESISDTMAADRRGEKPDGIIICSKD